jgi:hypothetical protein
MTADGWDDDGGPADVVLSSAPLMLWRRRAITGPAWLGGLVEVLLSGGGGPRESEWSVAVSTAGVTVVDPRLYDDSPAGRRRQRARRWVPWIPPTRFIPWDEILAVDLVRGVDDRRRIVLRRHDGSVCVLSAGHGEPGWHGAGDHLLEARSRRLRAAMAAAGQPPPHSGS